jgi:hypothetical protein
MNLQSTVRYSVYVEFWNLQILKGSCDDDIHQIMRVCKITSRFRKKLVWKK